MQRILDHYKEDILKACGEIESFLAGQDFLTFAKDVKTYNAVLMSLIKIGEASAHFPEEVREKNPSIRWTSIVGLRNFIAHEYFEVDPQKVWTTATVHVPELKKQIENLVF